MPALERNNFGNKTNSWYKRRTKFEKNLLGILLIVLLCVIFLAVLVIKNHQSARKISQELCQTKGCVETAAGILKNLNPAVDPCDNFYEFACGKFKEHKFIKENDLSASTFFSNREKVNHIFKRLLEAPIKKDDIKPVAYAKKIYKTCMNTTRIEQEGLDGFKKIMRDLGGWPVLEGNNWKEHSFDWKSTTYKFHKSGFTTYHFLSTYVSWDDKNSSAKRTYNVDQVTYYQKFFKKGMNDTFVKTYYDYAVELATAFGADKTQAVTELRGVMEFLVKLAHVSIPWEERRDMFKEYNAMTIREMQNKFPSIPWLQYLNQMVSPILSFSYTDVIIVRVPKYIKNLENLLLTTPKRVLANYMFFLLASSHVYSLTEELKKIRLRLDKVLLGNTAPDPRWQSCTYRARWLYLATESMYVKEVVIDKSKTKMEELVSDIKMSFIELIKKATWMDPKTKKRAIAKAEAMGQKIGYADELLNETKIEEFYKDLNLDEDLNLIDLGRNLVIFEERQGLEQFNKTVDKSDWTYFAFPSAINAFYDGMENTIKLPSGILQPPFFSTDRPQYLNYGALGHIIGHEITHGFDDVGRQYDKDGNLVDWWEPMTNKTFVEKTQCIIQQYSNITDKEVNLALNGVNTQGENIADNGGVKAAYMAYQKWLQRHNGLEPALPGLSYNPLQMFWIASANIWCRIVRPETLKLQIMNWSHSPSNYRVIIPLTNSGFFARDFNCPLGSPMNPRHKCRVW